ncbi:LacI family DNA-binding transcriptional regulator [Microbacterium sp.]|uniref:LacI family DNA-binding transcriptional regulator n=1 Tax=Microbacterium sp. TaxID=51671 RepID=UPI0039E51511
MQPRRSTTVHDVARRAGASVAAVSHALNGTGTLSHATRERIIAVASEMDYRADAVARELRRSPLGVFGVVIRPLDVFGHYRPDGVDVYRRVIGTLASAALDAGKGTMLLPDLTRRPLPPLALSLDGYIVIDPVSNDPVIELLDSREIPYVTLGRIPGRPAFSWWVSENDAQTIELILDSHFARGARSIHLVMGTLRTAWNLDSERMYRTWTRARGLTPHVVRVAEDLGAEGGRDAVARLLRRGTPDAVHCLTGRHAAGVLEGLRAHGLEVPRDVLLSAGSDAEPALRARPAISAAVLGHPELGQALVGLLIDRLAGGAAPPPRLLTPEYIERESTGLARPAEPRP